MRGLGDQRSSLPAFVSYPSSPMPALANRKHESFARAVACGESASAAYREHVSNQGKQGTVWPAASRLRYKVSARVREIRAALEDTDEFIAEKREILAYCTRVLRTPIGQIDADSDLCQEQVVTTTESDRSLRTTTRTKTIDKLGAATQIAKMRGYYEEDRTQAKEGDALSRFLASIGGWTHPERG